MAPSAVNNTGRQMMADIRAWYEDAQWVDFGHVPSYASAASFTIPGDVTAMYMAGRRVKLADSSTLFGTITGSSYSNPSTTVTVELDSGSVSASLTAVAVGVLTPSGGALFPVQLSHLAELAEDKILGRTTGTGTVEALDCTAAARALLGDATADEQLTTLGGTATGKALFTAASVAAALATLGVGKLYVGSLTRGMGTASGTQAVTGVGFQPRAVIALSSNDGASQSAGVGFAASGSSNGVRITSNHLLTAWARGSGFCGALTGSGIGYSGSIDSWDSDGFTINWTRTGAASGTLTVDYLAIQ
jgi:hypothetical protein